MSIVVFWLEADTSPAAQAFQGHQLAEALAHAELRRREGKHHVIISTELAESVGRPGVDTVADRKLPDGSDYDWSKAHRGKSPPRTRR